MQNLIQKSVGKNVAKMRQEGAQMDPWRHQNPTKIQVKFQVQNPARSDGGPIGPGVGGRGARAEGGESLLRLRLGRTGI